MNKKLFYGLLSVVLLVLIGGNFIFLNEKATHAQYYGGVSSSSGGVTSPFLPLPDANGVRDIQGGAISVSEGVTLIENLPTDSPGSDTQPLPSFSGINTPVWISEQGPVQIVDDAILWGLNDVRVGLINNGTSTTTAATFDGSRSTADISTPGFIKSLIPTARAQAASGQQEPQTTQTTASINLHPVTIYDDLLVNGNGASEPGEIRANGVIQAGAGITSTGQIQSTGDLTILDGNLTVDGNAVIGTFADPKQIMVTGGTTLLGNVAIGLPETPKGLALYGDLAIEGNTTSYGDVQIGLPSSLGHKTLTVNGTTTVNGNSLLGGGVLIGTIADPKGIRVTGDTTLLGNLLIGLPSTPKQVTLSGNLIITGTTTSYGDITIGTASNHKTLNVYGSVGANMLRGAELAVMNDATILENLTVGSATSAAIETLTVYGDIKGTQIGAFHVRTSDAKLITSNIIDDDWPTTATASKSCLSGEIILSCSGFFDPGPRAGQRAEFDSKINGTVCEVRARTSPLAASVRAQAVCFDPNG